MKASPGPHPVYETLDGQHCSKLAPLIYNLDRTPHTAGVPFLGKDQHTQQKCFRCTPVPIWISKVEGLLGFPSQNAMAPTSQPCCTLVSRYLCACHLWHTHWPLCSAELHFLPLLWLLLGQKGWRECCTVLHSHMVVSKRKKQLSHSEKLLHSPQLNITKIKV